MSVYVLLPCEGIFSAGWTACSMLFHILVVGYPLFLQGKSRLGHLQAHYQSIAYFYLSFIVVIKYIYHPCRGLRTGEGPFCTGEALLWPGSAPVK